MKPYLSIVIPFFRADRTIGRLVSSILRSKNSPPYEVIIVDDHSPHRSTIRVQSRSVEWTCGETGDVLSWKLPDRCVRFRYLYQPQNRGPAAARNAGVRVATGEFILFLDSDVALFPDTLRNIRKIYVDDPDVVALTGVWVKEQQTAKFFPKFKALRDWSYWINERDRSGYYFLFSTRIASIKKAVFDRLGGFDESYSGALVEDIELTHRIARRYAVIFAPTVRVRHEFEDFWPIARKYFWRTFYWTRLYRNRKKFDPVATTWQEALNALSGVAVVLFGIGSVISIPNLPLILTAQRTAPGLVLAIAAGYYLCFAAALVLHLLFNKTFLAFAYREYGFIFMLKSFLTGLVLYCFIVAGAVWGRLKG